MKMLKTQILATNTDTISYELQASKKLNSFSLTKQNNVASKMCNINNSY